jgi:dihydropteroate synthase
MTGSSAVAGPGRRALPVSLDDEPVDRAARSWRLRLPGGRTLALGERPLVMGVVNVTPDSFSDGGLHLDPVRAADHALRLIEEGADLLDLGAESTRPGGGVYGAGAATVTADEECRRLLPVLRRLRDQTRAPLSVDTRKAAVARAALDEGADLVNDVSCLADPGMAGLIATHDVPIVLMHSRGELATMQREIHFEDVVAEVCQELEAALDDAAVHGIPLDQTIVDPGIGFGKTLDQNLALLARLDALHALGRPVLVGASRKSFIGRLTGEPAPDRLAGSLAAAAWAFHGRAQVVRVHDVAQTVSFRAVWEAIDATARSQGTSRAPRRPA